MLGHIYFLGSLTGLALLPIVDEAHGYALLLAVVLGGALVATIESWRVWRAIPSDRLEADRGRGTGMRRNGVPNGRAPQLWMSLRRSCPASHAMGVRQPGESIYCRGGGQQ